MTMDLISRSQVILPKIYEFSRLSMADSDETAQHALQQLLHRWSEVLAAADDASDDELFFLNISRAYITNAFSVAFAKDCFTTDHSFTYQIVRTCFDLLINHMDIFKSTSTTFFISNICLIMTIPSALSSVLWCTDISLFHDNEDQLFIAMREYVDRDFLQDDLTDGIVSFVWSTSDNSSLVPLFLKAGYAKSLIEWMKTCERKFREDKHVALLSILLNMSRHDDGIDQFNALDAINTLQCIPFDSSQSLQRTMIYILLTDVNQIKFESMEMLNMLVQLCVNAANNEKHRYDGSHVCEPLTVLTKLFHNDQILLEILSNIETKPALTAQSMIELFISLLIQFYPKLSFDNNPLENFTCVLVVNFVWLISCHQEYRQIIHNHEQLMMIIRSTANNEKNFLDTFMPRTMKNIQQAAIDILKNLDEISEPF